MVTADLLQIFQHVYVASIRMLHLSATLSWDHATDVELESWAALLTSMVQSASEGMLPDSVWSCIRELSGPSDYMSCDSAFVKEEKAWDLCIHVRHTSTLQNQSTYYVIYIFFLFSKIFLVSLKLVYTSISF